MRNDYTDAEVVEEMKDLCGEDGAKKQSTKKSQDRYVTINKIGQAD